MKIAIKFGDNDFYNTWVPLLNSFHEAHLNEDIIPLDKEKLLFIINKLSYGFYLLHQNQFRYGDETIVRDSHIKDYLILTKDKLLLDDEVDEYLKSINGIDNYSTHILDTELFNNNIYTV